MIWFLLTCKEQEEENMLILCRKRLSKSALQSAAVLTYDRMRRYEGTWHLERKILFPAHVLLESKNEETLIRELIEYGVITEQDNSLIPISSGEANFLKVLCGEERHLGISRGIIKKDVMKILEGPLRGMEDRICKIDRHKRLARIMTTIKKDGNVYVIPAGLEITEKIL